MKTCAKCKAEKPYSEFRKHVRNKDGYQYYCKYCQNQMSRESRFKKQIKCLPGNFIRISHYIGTRKNNCYPGA